MMDMKLTLRASDHELPSLARLVHRMPVHDQVHFALGKYKETLPFYEAAYSLTNLKMAIACWLRTHEVRD